MEWCHRPRRPTTPSRDPKRPTAAPITTPLDPNNDRVLDQAENEALRALLIERQRAGESDAFDIFASGGVAQVDMIDDVCRYLLDFPFNGLVSAIASAGWSEEGAETYVTELARVTCRDLLPESRR